MKRAIFFVLLLTVESVSFSQNLVVNPGFETWGKITKPFGWVHAENCSKDSSFVMSGNYSCLHSGGATTTSDLGQTITVLPGKEYTLSLYYKTVITSSGNGARIWCYWKNVDGNSITDPSTDAILRPSKYMKSDTWQQFNINITAPPAAVAFYLEVRTYTNSTAWWDDFVFEENMTTWDPARYESLLNIYPNPAHDYLIINYIQSLKHIDIQSLTGTNIWSFNFSGEQTVTIPVSGLPDGLYILSILTSDKLIIRKFIKKAN
jgi:hypothetical protein